MLSLNPTGSSVIISSKLIYRHIQFGQAVWHFDRGIYIKLTVFIGQ